MREWIRICRYAVLLSNEGLVIPASYLFELSDVGKLLRALAPVVHAGLFGFASETADLGDYALKKRQEYRDELPLFPRYTVNDPAPHKLAEGLSWRPRVSSASGAIASAWATELERSGGFWQQLLSGKGNSDRASKNRVERAIAAVPDRLEGRAFIFRFARPLIPIDLPLNTETRTKLLLSKAYLESYLSELDAVIFVDTPLGGLDCGLSRHDSRRRLQTVSWRLFYDWFQTVGIDRWIDDRLTLPDLIRLRNHPVIEWLIACTVHDENSDSALRQATRVARFDSTHAHRRSRTRSRPYDRVSDQLWRFHASVAPYFESFGSETRLALVPPRPIIIRPRRIENMLPADLREPIDLIILVALEEEFRELARQLGQPIADRDRHTGLYFYRFKLPVTEAETCECVATLVGQMGAAAAAVVAEICQGKWRAGTIANLGIAASLSTDVQLGDAICVSVADNYLERSKAVDVDGGQDFEFELSGEPYRPSKQLVDDCQHLEFAHPELFRSWGETCRKRLDELLAPEQVEALVHQGIVRTSPSIVVGHLASGPTVAASIAFREWVRKRDRVYLGLEMEAGGILTSTYFHGSRAIVLKGASDFGDERKKNLDNLMKGALRTYGMHNVVGLLSSLARTGAFRHEWRT
jgi:nucleoside phosphorylase